MSNQPYTYQVTVVGDIHVGSEARPKVFDCRIEQFHPGLPHKWRVIQKDSKVEWVDFTCTRALYRATIKGKEKRSYRRITVDHERRCVIVHIRRNKKIALNGPLYDKYADYIAKSLLE